LQRERKQQKVSFKNYRSCREKKALFSPLGTILKSEEKE